ncbi:MAG: hypothetical protein QNL59_03720 [Actinomycetota bacterium]
MTNTAPLEERTMSILPNGVLAPDGAVLTVAVALGSSSYHRFVGFGVTEPCAAGRP